MRKLIIEKTNRISRNRPELEKELKVKITKQEKEIFINGNPEDEFIAEKVIEALNFGFPFQTTLNLKNPEVMFEKINIKDYSKSKNLERIRARIIGTKGRTLATLTQISHCAFELKNNKIGIIGNNENIKTAQDAIIALIQGSKTSNVYSFIEKSKPQPIVDLGLKKDFKE
ncbi:MAG: hypothetical protein ACOCUU_02520 [Nanoarchaeota archaeon]